MVEDMGMLLMDLQAEGLLTFEEKTVRVERRGGGASVAAVVDTARMRGAKTFIRFYFLFAKERF